MNQLSFLEPPKPDITPPRGMTSQAFECLIDDMTDAPMVVCDIEGTGLDLWGGDVLIGIALYIPHVDRSYYVPIDHGTGHFGELPNVKHGVKYPSKYDKLTDLWRYTHGVMYAKANVPGALDRLAKVWPTVKAWQMYNAQFDMLGLELAGLPRIEAPVYDVMVASHLYNSDWRGSTVRMPDGKMTRGNNSLKWQAAYNRVSVTVDGQTIDATSGEARLESDAARLQKFLSRHGSKHPINSKKHLWALHPDAVGFYAQADVRMTWGLWQVYQRKLDAFDLRGLYEWLCAAQCDVAYRMQRTGFRFDRSAADAMLKKNTQDADATLAEIRNMTVPTFNPNSNAQVRELLRRTGADVTSADEKTLKEHADKHAAIPLIMRYKKLTKSNGTYTAAWADAAFDDIIHPSFNVTGTVTGRWSSSSDRYGNMQNIPRDSVGANSPKALLLPHTPDHVLCEFDYDTLEIRIMAWIAEHILKLDPDFTLSRIGIGDMHTYTMERIGIADILLGKPVNEANVIEYYEQRNIPVPDGDVVKVWLKKVVRSVAKIMNFAAAYGGGANALLQVMPDLDRSTAQTLMDGWRDTYPSIPAATKLFQDGANTHRTHPNGGSGFHVLYPDVGIGGRFMRNFTYYDTRAKGSDGTYDARDKAAYKAFNSAVQGTAGLLTIEAAKRVSRAFREGGVLEMYATIHDSIIVGIHRDSLHVARDIMRLMSDFDITPALSVGLDASPPGQAWGYKREVKDIDVWIASRGGAVE